MDWPRISQVPNISWERMFKRVYWTGCLSQLRRNCYMWVDGNLLKLYIAAFRKTFTKLHYLYLIHSRLSMPLKNTFPRVIVYFINLGFLAILMFIRSVFFFQHWISIQELLRHFWSSYPITTSYLYAKVSALFAY